MMFDDFVSVFFRFRDIVAQPLRIYTDRSYRVGARSRRLWKNS